MRVPLFFVVIAIVSCHSNSLSYSDQSGVDDVLDSLQTITCNCTDTAAWYRGVKDDTNIVRRSTLVYVSYVDVVNKQIKGNPKYKNEYLNIDTLISGINSLYKEMPLEKVKQSHDTLYIKINNTQYFESQLDSINKEFYIAQAAYNLTSVPGTKYIQFEFDNKSSNFAKVWSRGNLKEYKVVK